MAITKAKPQTMKTACGNGYIECEKDEAKSFSFENAGIYYDALGKASSIYYWSKKDNKFNYQLLSD